MSNFKVKQKKGKDGVILKVDGKVTIENVAEMRELLMAAFTAGKVVTVDLAGVEEIDVNGMQLICAAHRTSLGLDKQLVVLGSTQPNVRGATQLAGYPRHVGCIQDVTKTCVWMEGA